MAISALAFPLFASRANGAGLDGAVNCEVVSVDGRFGAVAAAELIAGACVSSIGVCIGNLGSRSSGGGGTNFLGFGRGGGGGSVVSALVTKSGAGRSRGISILGAGTEMNTCFDFGFGEVAMIACSESSAPRGSMESPVVLTGATSGTFWRKS